MANQKFKTKVQADAGVQLTQESASKVLQLDASGNVQSSSVTTTELGYLSGTTSSIQTQINSKASDTLAIKKDGSVAFTADQSLGGFKITNLADPVSAQDAATKSYVDAIKQGLDIKDSVRLASTANIPLSGGASLTVDGVSVANNDRLLLKDQTTGSENGIYTVSGIGSSYSLTRSIDANTSSKVTAGLFTFVAEGTLNGDYGFVLTTNDPIILGTTSLVFTQFSGAGQIIAGTGLTKSGNTLSITNTAVSASSYGSASNVGTFTVNAQGQLTAASNTPISITSSQVSDFTNSAKDAAGAALSNTNTVNLSYNSGTKVITADAKTQMSITSDSSGLKLQGDSATPGNVKYYGTDSSGVKGFYTIPNTGASAGDITETSFSAANNQSVAANVTGLAFATGTVRSFQAIVSVTINATSALYEQFTLEGIQKGASFDMAVRSVGDDSGMTFSITSAGQVQYTSTNLAGFVSNTVKFRAQTLTV